jgi:predicted ATPase
LLQSPTKLHTLSGLRLEHTNFTRPKPLLLLAYLCLEGKQEKRFLAELFWPGASNHLNSLAKALSQLRQVGVIDNDDTHAWATVSSDVSEFLEALEQHDLEKATTLYQDSFLAGVYLPDWSVELEEWVYATREFLAARMREGLLELAETSEDKREATGYAQRAYELKATLEPDLLPRFYRFLFDTPDAAKLKQEAKEYGISLEQAKTIHSNLPARGTSFVGRDIERLELAELLSQADARLVTIVGQGGVGKTRLALELAREVKESFPDGVVYIPLEALRTSEQVFSSLASAFSVRLTKDNPREEIAKTIGGKVILLLLDNAEHLLEAMQEVSLLLRECPNLKLLVTSRSRLNLEEEWLYALEGFVVSHEVKLETARLNDGVTLFVQRAKKVKQGFTLSNECLPFVLKICERVEGLPLGIELAASWLKTLSCEEVAENLVDLDFLTTSLSNIPERQQSLRSVFEGSWRLLSEEEQGVLSKLSVFRGGFTREAAREVAAATLMTLARLVDKSLLRVSQHRYEQHPLLRSFAEEKLQNSEETRERQAIFFLNLVETYEPHLRGSEQQNYFKPLSVELDNIRASLDWFLKHDKILAALRLASGLHYFWSWWPGLTSEGRKWLEQALERSPEGTAYRAKALFSGGALSWLQGDNAVASLRLEESLSISRRLGDTWSAAKTLGHLGLATAEQGHYDRAKLQHEESLRLFRELKDSQGIAAALHNLGILATRQGDFGLAQRLYEEALPLYQGLAYRVGIANLLNSLARVAWEQNDLPGASTFAEEALRHHRELSNMVGVATALYHLALVAKAQQDRSLAVHLLQESLLVMHRNGQKSGMINALEGLASLVEDDPERAVQVWSATETFRKLIGLTRTLSFEKRHALELARVKATLSEEAFASAWTKGSVMGLEETIMLVLEAPAKNS